ncbi:single-stranded-DNA-specific exonuclease RecJ [Salipiger mucosus]|uniref:Single-stranded-DNA-specific exonuclease RecJ n=1 Tax=Salipiger mucosus DSM 16094 TaxID=1123237 RepID=S9QWN2_9RHOB|nr:single-stranded-DNA-specific exonuclease RecJ [Salipiger mucosus]EPX83992.1 Single-stranded-DNA-specific exonuclease RecJ [Salipiger mucosus DSM 16094]
MSGLSVRGLEWSAPEEKEGSFPGIPSEVVSIALNRGIEDLGEFFKPTLKGSMPDPLVLKDMDKAIERGKQAVLKNERVCIFGDYDVDGATSTSILKRFLETMGCEVSFYIPQRLTEGYGPNVPAIEKIAEDEIDLIIFADCGTVAFEPLARAAALGMDVVTLDHHLSDDKHPEGILVNPNRNDETGDYGYLCTAGIAFLYVVGLQRALREDGFFEDRTEYDMHHLLGLACFGTVADVVPLVGFNRAMVKIGLRHMARNPGLMALAECNEVEPESFNERTCGFVFGPCINAGGRIDDTWLGTLLLTCDDLTECAERANALYEINKERKAKQQLMEAGAFEQAEAHSDDNVIVCYNEDWHPGVVGIVASRITEAYDRPSIVIGEGGKGSARSIEGFDVGRPIKKAAADGILIKGGGHEMAAGVTIDPEKLEAFRDAMNAAAGHVDRPPLVADIDVPCGGISRRLVESLNLLAPFGANNSEPRAMISGGMLISTKVLKEKHVKGRISGEAGDIDIIMFNAKGTPMGDAILAAKGSIVDVYGRVEINEYMGNVSIQVKPEDVRPQKQPELAF